MLRPILCLVALCGLSPALLSQTQTVKSQPAISGQVGIGFTAADPDMGISAISGIAIYGNYNVGKHFGITGEINLPRFHTPRDIGESTYIYGARYQFNKGLWHPYAKGMFGLGSVQDQGGFTHVHTSLHYPAYVFGGGIDLFLKHKINVRLIDLEYQFLPGFAPNGLTPFEGTVGVARRF